MDTQTHIPFTPEQVAAFAPDTKVALAARSLATPSMWQTVGRIAPHNDTTLHAVWGECKGSGKKPYHVQVDMSFPQPAFHCTCTAFRFKPPCKHAIALLLLLANNVAAIPIAAPPAWVADWLAARAERAAKQPQKSAKTATTDSPATTSAKDANATSYATAQQPRATARDAMVAAGMQEIEMWLHDLLRQGIASAQHANVRFWHAPAQRMVDAQAPGIARILLAIADIPTSDTTWSERVLAHIGNMVLLIEGYKQRHHLSPDQHTDIRTMIGYTQRQDDVLQQDGINDDWLVLGSYVEDEPSLNARQTLHTRRTWLWACRSQRAALLLDFAYGKQAFATPPLVPGMCFDADLVFYPSAYPLRAIIKTQHRLRHEPPVPSAYATLDAALDAYSSALARMPWLERLPFVVDNVQLAYHPHETTPITTTWGIADAHGAIVPIAAHFNQHYQLLAMSGGAAVRCAMEWNGTHCVPFAIWQQHHALYFYTQEGNT